MTYKVMVVEDDKTLRETLEYNLTSNNYEVIAVGDGHKAIEMALAEKPDLILLDVMLPGLDGFEVCRILRTKMNTPILMLTARIAEVDKIVGLEVGADDYLTKPFSMRELMARVKALLRRLELNREDLAADQSVSGKDMKMAGRPPATFHFDNLVINQSRREVTIDGQVIRLKPKEYELLRFLASNRGIALSRSLILERVWGWSYDGNSRTVDVHVRWLREKIEPDPGNPGRIVTVRGLGYRFDG